MANVNTSPAKAKAKAKAEAKAVKPPGRVRGSGHGPQEAVKTEFGIAHLRHVLTLSGDVPIENVCEDAAVEIETLRRKENRVPDGA